jgi:hypothetical protein
LLWSRPVLDALPPSPPASYSTAPGDIYPRGSREEDLCATASHPDWIYLGALVALDAGSFYWGSTDDFKRDGSAPKRYLGPAMIGLTWGATLGGGYLAMPKCDPHWVTHAPREGGVRASWPLALSIALVAGATAPIVNAIAVGNCYDAKCQGGFPDLWDNTERSMHLVVAGVAGFGGALLPYLVPPRTWSAAKELEHLRVGADARGNVVLGIAGSF